MASRLANVPNFISIARLLAVPLVVWLILENRFEGAFWVFILAGISDAVDGFIAKQMDAESELGMYLDPIADKVLLVSVYLSLGVENILPGWLVILVVFRDVLIVGGVLLSQTFIEKSVKMAPLWISKINTTAQIGLAAFVLAWFAFNLGTALTFIVADALVDFVAATTFFSGMAYLVRWVRGFSESESVSCQGKNKLLFG